MQAGYLPVHVIAQLQCTAYTDADFAGCVATHIPTTTGLLCIEGSNSHCPIHALSTRQDSAVSSTPEADIVAAGTVLRTRLTPALYTWDVLLDIPHMLDVHKDDIEAAIRAMVSGNTTYHGARTMRVW